jgi:hypothetical protein
MSVYVAVPEVPVVRFYRLSALTSWAHRLQGVENEVDDDLLKLDPIILAGWTPLYSAGRVSCVTSPSPPVEAPKQPRSDQPQMRTRRSRQA